MNFTQDEFLDFLLEAKRNTYAAQGDDASVPSLLDGSRQLEFRSGDFLYRDIYFGMAYFTGQETVYYQGTPVWAMSYSGGVLKPHPLEMVREIYAFLRRSMLQIDQNNSYRGPQVFIEGNYVYLDTHEGVLEDFSGTEKILHNNTEVYHLHYAGGYLRY